MFRLRKTKIIYLRCSIYIVFHIYISISRYERKYWIYVRSCPINNRGNNIYVTYILEFIENDILFITTDCLFKQCLTTHSTNHAIFPLSTRDACFMLGITASTWILHASLAAEKSRFYYSPTGLITILLNSQLTFFLAKFLIFYFIRKLIIKSFDSFFRK